MSFQQMRMMRMRKKKASAGNQEKELLAEGFRVAAEIEKEKEQA